MERGRRMKASDVFRESNFLLSEKAPFAKAFPEIERVRLEYQETGRGVFGEGRYVIEYPSPHGGGLGEYRDCSNPLCYNGGFSVGRLLRQMVPERRTRQEFSVSCQGYEGSPKGKRNYGPCPNHFTGVVTVVYREPHGSGKARPGAPARS